MIDFENGIGIDGLEFRLDASRRCDYGFVSHAHSDHARKHKKIICTPETALLYKLRYPNVPVRVIPYGRKVKFDDAVIELLPSGHMLGAAQILVEVNRTRILYTGDFKIYPNLTCSEIETTKCDILIMESTYGDPAASFPPQNEVYARMVMFIKRTHVDGNIPVLVGYTMGKAQEAVVLAQKQGYKVCVDPEVEKINKIYRAAGVQLGETENYQKAKLNKKVIVVCPQTLRKNEFKELRRKRSLFLSGWSNSQRKWNFGTDRSVPLSDHADFTQLLSYIEKCSPRKIYTLHGEPKFAKILREMGYNAQFLEKGFKEKTNRLQDNLLTVKKKVEWGNNYELF